MSRTGERASGARWFEGLQLFFLCAFLLSLFSSMAAMEIASWTLFLIAVTGVAFTRWQDRKGVASLGWRPFRIGVDWALAALIVTVFIGYVLNRDSGANLGFIMGGVRWIATLYALAWILRWRKVSPLIVAPYAFSLAVAGIYGIVTFIYGWDFWRKRVIETIAQGGWNRAVSFLGFPMTWGHTAAMAFSFGVGVLAARTFDMKSRRDRWLCAGLVAATVLGGLNVGLTFTRGAWIAAVGGTLVCAMALGVRCFLRFSGAGALVVVLICAASSDVRSRALTIFSTTEISSNMQRIQLWEANWRMFEEHPIFGVGLNENERLTDDYHHKLGHDGAFSGHAHNNYLQWLSSAGAVGFVLFLGIFGWFLRWAWVLARWIPREHAWARALALGSLGAQTALHVGGLTECTFKAMSVNHHFMFQLALIAALKNMYGNDALAARAVVCGRKKAPAS